MKKVSGDLFYVLNDDSYIIPYRGTVRDGKVVEMEYDAPKDLAEAIWAPVASEVHESIMREAKT